MIILSDSFIYQIVLSDNKIILLKGPRELNREKCKIVTDSNYIKSLTSNFVAFDFNFVSIQNDVANLPTY